MSIKLNIGISRKIGLPNYGSAGASCSLETELDSSTLETDTARFYARVEFLYDACAQAVWSELRKLKETGQPSHATIENGNGYAQPPRRADDARAATPAQLRALNSLAEQGGITLFHLLQSHYDFTDPAQLTISQASRLISELRGESIP